MSNSSLHHWLTAASLLLGKNHPEPASQLQSVLLSRLVQFNEHLRLTPSVNDDTSVSDVQLATAQAALTVLEHVQPILAQNASSPSAIPDLGTRDIRDLRTTISIVFRWGTQPLLAKLSTQWLPSRTSSISEFGGKQHTHDYQLLCDMITRILGVMLATPEAVLQSTVITDTLVDRHLSDVWQPAIALGWLPKSLAVEETPSLSSVKPLVMRLLAILSSAEAMSALGTIIGEPNCPQHVRRTCAAFLSRQLLRPDGVKGLCAAIFGEDRDAEASLDKLENIAQLLCTTPSGVNPTAYYKSVIPRVLLLLTPDAPEAHRRAASFTISRILAESQTFLTQKEAAQTVLKQLHDPLLAVTLLPGESSSPLGILSPGETLKCLTVLLANINPSPELIVSLLSPIIASLYCLLSYLDGIKTSDPELKETLRSIIFTWGRIAATTDSVSHLWQIIGGDGGYWKFSLTGEIMRIEEPEQATSLDLLTPESLEQALENDDMSVNSNLLDLRPDPVHFVRLIAKLGRSDVASELFVKLLEAYNDHKTAEDADPTRSLLYVQLIIQMQAQLNDDKSSRTNILDNPGYLVSFIAHVLKTSQVKPRKKQLTVTPTGLDRLRFISTDEDHDDELEELEDDSVGMSDELIETAVNLLLSIFERNPNLSARSSPELNEVFDLLSPLMSGGNENTRKLAGEARMVMTARLASTSAPHSGQASNAAEEDPRAVYQKALKLLQDPILPVRAHGLLLLRDLVSPANPKKKTVEPALIPAILGIFMQSIQDDDSYIFLNGIQGLSTIVNTYGKEVLGGLVKEYAGGLGGLAVSALTQQDIDVRSRVGEALGQIIRRCNDTLSSYIDMIVPPLFEMVRNKHLPPVLRTSSLSLLADCARTQPIALRHYVAELSDAIVDLLQTEGVTTVEPQPGRGNRESEQSKDIERVPTMDTHPTSVNSKFPPMRRSALHFLSLLIKAAIEHSASRTELDLLLPPWLVVRAKTTVGYTAETDADEVVRIMARETLDLLKGAERAQIGL